MITKEAIKAIVLSGATVKLPYKDVVREWYGDIGICRNYKRRGFDISPFNIRYANIDDAVNVFCNMAYTSGNAGYVLERLRDSGYYFDLDAGDDETQGFKARYAEMVEIIDDEAKSLNIVLPPVFTPEQAIAEFKKRLGEATNFTEFQAALLLIDAKYAQLDPYMAVHIFFDLASQTTPYSTSYEICETPFGRGITEDIVEEMKQVDDGKIKFNHIEVVLKVRQSNDYIRFTVNI